MLFCFVFALLGVLRSGGGAQEAARWNVGAAAGGLLVLLPDTSMGAQDLPPPESFRPADQCPQEYSKNPGLAKD